MIQRLLVAPPPWLALAVGLLFATAVPLSSAYGQETRAAECADDTTPPQLHPKEHRGAVRVAGTSSDAKIKLVFTEPIKGLATSRLSVEALDGASLGSTKVSEVVDKGKGKYLVIVSDIEAETRYRLRLDAEGLTDACGNPLVSPPRAEGELPETLAEVTVDIQVKQGWLKQFAPIALLLVVVGFVLWRLPRVEIEHSKAFRRRRFFNWFPLGLTYAFLYMGRYNLTVSKSYFAEEGLMTNEQFGTIFAIGAVTYGIAFMINGPLCDRIGGRKTMLIGTAGSALMNLLMGLVVILGYTSNLMLLFSILFAGNMYFQSFGAVSIVKVNAGWFHVRERGVLGGVFGILISLGVYFAYDLNGMIADATTVEWVFFAPTAVLAVFFVLDFLLVRDRPADAGFENFHLGDATADEDDSPPLGVMTVLKKMMANPIIVTIIVIEFCSGFLRNAIMQWGVIFSKQTGASEQFVFENWGMMLAIAGILAGMFAGVISDYVFNSRRGPVAAILYGGMVLGGGVLFFVLGSPVLGWTVVFMSLCIIGVHGMLSGTASMDFGGRKNAGVAVGIIDAAVYLGTGFQSILLGQILPDGPEAADASNWVMWPSVMMPLALLGLIMAMRIWNAKPAKKVAAGH